MEFSEASVKEKVLTLFCWGVKKREEEVALLTARVVVPYSLTVKVVSLEESYWTLSWGVEEEVMVTEPEEMMPPPV